jgi:hypothetical protein
MAKNERQVPVEMDDSRSMAAMAADVGRIARDLNRLVIDAEVSKKRITPKIMSGITMTMFARRLMSERRERENTFGADFFADPAWDMILDLFIAHEEKRKISVSSLCIAAAVPPTTALRWIKSLTEKGIFVRSDDPDDGRRGWIALSPEMHSRMQALISYWMEARAC